MDEQKSWLSYLTFGYLGPSQDRIALPGFAPLSHGPGLYRIHEPVNAAVE